jgi:hypothetical protein
LNAAAYVGSISTARLPAVNGLAPQPSLRDRDTEIDLSHGIAAGVGMQRRREGDCEKRDARREGKVITRIDPTIAMPLLRVQAFTAFQQRSSKPCAMVAMKNPPFSGIAADALQTSPPCPPLVVRAILTRRSGPAATRGGSDLFF